MYSEWSALEEVIGENMGQCSVLQNFPSVIGRDVSCSVVKSLARHLSINAADCQASTLVTDKQVLWTMEVLWHGLSLQMAEYETINDCVNVYCEWLTAMTTPRNSVPIPVLEDPNAYTQTIIRHFYSLFVPRDASGVDRQAMLCHRVLRTLENLARDSPLMAPDTWSMLLQFLLAVNDTLLSPPIVKDGLGAELSRRVVSVLFKLWMLACARCFPSPTLWKTLRNMCLNWRHHVSLVDQWNRANLLLTARMLRIMYGPNFPELKLPQELKEESAASMVADVDDDRVAQTWFRFLHVLTNPVHLSSPAIVSNTPRFLHMALTSEAVIDPAHHPCLHMLPEIFLKAMKGIAAIVDSFLGIPQPELKDVTAVPVAYPKQTLTPATGTPPMQKKKVGLSLKESKKSSSNIAKQQSTPVTPTVGQISLSLDNQKSLAADRPKCNSILHLLGAWLFEAALVGCPISTEAKDSADARRSGSFISRTTTGAGPGAAPALTGSDALELELSYEAGRAEAVGALCRVFCSHKTGEGMLAVYYARFYIVVRQALSINEQLSGPVLSSLLFNSSNLLRTDLEGIMVLLPDFVAALEIVLPEKEPRFKLHPSIPLVELRRASIHLLLSMIALPLHFRNLPIKEIVRGSSSQPQHVTFLYIKSRLVNLLVSGLQVETDSLNTQMLLGGLLTCVQDSALCEEVDQVTAQEEMIGGNESSNNLLGPDEGTSPRQGSSWSLDSDRSSRSSSSCNREFDSAQAQFIRAIYLVCHRLISTWKTDLNVSLAALELLSGLAKMKLKQQDLLECKRAVCWICDYIVYQCSRPPPAHSKDLHSTIVAAYQCVATWLVDHHELLADKECLNTVLEVVEMGISGSKSQPKHNDPPVYKGDKELKPASMRVRDAAEGALSCMLELVGSFPPPSGPESLNSELNEESLLRYTKGVHSLEHRRSFRYFVVENSTILGMLEQPLGNDQDPLPTVVVINRSPQGRHAWMMQLRQLSRKKSLQAGSRSFLVPPPRPQPKDDCGTHYTIKQSYFPESVDNIPQTRAEKSIPTLSSLVTEARAEEYARTESFVQQQVNFEAMVRNRAPKGVTVATDCQPPGVCHEFQTARLALSHLGFLSLEALKSSDNSPVPSLIALDSGADALHADVDALDTLRSRTSDTLFVFYVRSGQKNVDEILANATAGGKVDPHFYEVLHSMGWPVNVHQHPGWNGLLEERWLQQAESVSAVRGGHHHHHHHQQQQQQQQEEGPYDAVRQILYWADHATELAIIAPSPRFLHCLKHADARPRDTVNHAAGDTGTAAARAYLAAPMREDGGGENESNAADHVTDHVTQQHVVAVPTIVEHGEETDGPPPPRDDEDSGGGALCPSLGTSPMDDASPDSSPAPAAHAASATLDLGGDPQRKRHSNPTAFISTMKRMQHRLRRQQSVPEGAMVSVKEFPYVPLSNSTRTPADGTAVSARSALRLELDLEKQKTDKDRVERMSDSPTASPDLNASNSMRKKKHWSRQLSVVGHEMKVMLVWLESFEDNETFPASELMAELSSPEAARPCDKDTFLIFVHALQSGLFRVHLRGGTSSSGRISMATPLVDGMLVSRRTLGMLVRQTTVNMHRRRRLDSDMYQPPHVKRRLKIQEIALRYRSKLAGPEFYAALFDNVTHMQESIV